MSAHTDRAYTHGERIYVTVDLTEKAAFRALGGRYGHGMAPFHDLASNSKFVTCAVHETDPDPTEHDCCMYHDRDYTLFYTPEQARNLKAIDKALYWKAWYWSNAPVRDDLDSEPDIRQHLAAVHAQSLPRPAPRDGGRRRKSPHAASRAARRGATGGSRRYAVRTLSTYQQFARADSGIR
jgi:hypothetical protein